MDPDWSLIFGDALHNYRSTLDHLVYVLSSTGGREPPHRCEFPLYAEKTGDSGFFRFKRNGDFVPGCGAWKIRGIRKRPQQIIRGLQPYQRGQQARTHPLWVLHELNIRDKHRLLSFAASHVRGAVVYNERFPIEPVYGRFIDGSILAYVGRAGDPKPKPNVDFELLFDVVLDQEGAGDGWGVRGILADTRECVQTAIARLEAFVSYPRSAWHVGRSARRAHG